MAERQVRRLLLDLSKRDELTRRRLAREGALFHGYHPEMEAVHVANARELEAILDSFGWPGLSIAGEDGAEAAWTIAQHAISLPELQRRALGLLTAAAERGEAPRSHVAYLTDRIRFNERRPQLYGTVFDWDRAGQLSPWRIEDPQNVESRRAAVGLPPLEEQLPKLRVEATREGNRPPPSHTTRQREIEAWARKVGWVDDK